VTFPGYRTRISCLAGVVVLLECNLALHNQSPTSELSLRRIRVSDRYVTTIAGYSDGKSNARPQHTSLQRLIFIVLQNLPFVQAMEHNLKLLQPQWSFSMLA
jgi:hypothetical protein